MCFIVLSIDLMTYFLKKRFIYDLCYNLYCTKNIFNNLLWIYSTMIIMGIFFKNFL